MGDNVDKIIGILKDNFEYGLTLTELIAVSGFSYSEVINVLEKLEDKNILLVKSDGLSRVYNLKKIN